MRINHIVLLGVAILSGIYASASLVPMHQTTIGQSSRHLRVGKERVDNEERNIASLNRLMRMANSSKSKITDKVNIQSWQKQEKSADEVFVLLKLDRPRENLFATQNFKTWLRYVDTTVKVQTKSAMVSILVARYGDEGLARMLQAAKNDPRSNKVVTMLQTEQMWIWITNGKTIDDIFTLLKLDDGVDKVLTNPTLSAWDDYIQFYNKNTGKKPTSMIHSLMVFYGDEAIAKMLEAAKKNPSTNKIATELQSAQFSQWLREGAKPAQIWKMLNMNKKTWMTNPDAEVWRGYLAFYKLQKSRTK